MCDQAALAVNIALVDIQHCPVHLVHPAHQDAQETQDKDPQDHLDLEVNQVMADQDLKETKEMLVSHPALVHTTLDHQDHLDQQDPKDQQDLLDQEDTKVNQVLQVCPVLQEALKESPTPEGFPSLDHQVLQGLLDLKDHKDTKGTLELLEPLEFQVLQEVPSHSTQVPLVLLVPLALQAPSLHPARCASISLTI